MYQDDGAFRERVDLFFRQAEDLSDLADDGVVLEGGIGREQGDVFLAVPAENVRQYLVAFFPGKVEVEVGRIGAVRIDEAFEVEVEVDRIDVRDAQA